jgi:hypothetical protein
MQIKRKNIMEHNKPTWSKPQLIVLTKQTGPQQEILLAGCKTAAAFIGPRKPKCAGGATGCSGQASS